VTTVCQPRWTVDLPSATDLKTWEFRNNVLIHSSATELRRANIGRPKVICNSSTGQFVMWMHKGTQTTSYIYLGWCWTGAELLGQRAAGNPTAPACPESA
jgi:hypothetical protein